MLILSRKVHESIVIDGQITVTVLRVAGDVVKLGIAAPAAIPVHRQEIFDEIKRNQSLESPAPRPQPPKPPSES
jgi:carbon storage regulator